MPRSFLGVSKGFADAKIPVTKVELDNKVDPNVQIKSMGADMVPVYEEHAARLEAGYKLNEWGGLPMEEKAMVVALRRNRIAIDNIQADEQIKHARRNAKRK